MWPGLCHRKYSGVPECQSLSTKPLEVVLIHCTLVTWDLSEQLMVCGVGTMVRVEPAELVL